MGHSPWSGKHILQCKYIFISVLIYMHFLKTQTDIFMGEMILGL